MKFEILLSCMHQKDNSIINRANIKTNALIVNQCDENNDYSVKIDNNKTCRFIYTKERGLSKSRNMALRNSNADICLIADDDETFCDDLENKIVSTFELYPYYDLITFNVENGNKKLKKYDGDVGYLKSLMTASCQIAFRRKSILSKGIFFCEKMGSGTGNGGGEENKFLFDCLKSKLRIKHVSITIASLPTTRKSKWFHGFNEKFFKNRGWSTKQYLGSLGAFLYAIEYCVAKYTKYKKDISFLRALKYSLKGIVEKK